MKFDFVENIGNGGFGIVDKVKDENGNLYAKKTFSINQGPSFPKHLEENVMKRFIREAQIQNELVHDNIVPIIEMSLEDTPPSFIMKLADSSLDKDIANSKDLNGEFLDAILDILAGLEALHDLEIYHRDLKPANILRFQNSRNYYAISDFGLISINQTQISTLTQTGMRMGSDYYTAPEIVKDLRKASIQSDIYSVGCILHDFVGTEDRIPCGEIDEDGDYSAILRNCTRKDPSRRFKSVKHLREAILSLGDVSVTASKEKNIKLFETLDEEPENISEESWFEIITYIEDEYDNEYDPYLLMKKISIQQIDFLLANYLDLGNRLGLMFAKRIRNTSFSFDYCDGLSLRLSKFVDYCKINVKSECLMAMLYLGTSHNRWYVEGMFVGYIGDNLPLDLAKRLAIEFITDSRKAKRALKHLEHSIHYNLNNMHKNLIDAYNKL